MSNKNKKESSTTRKDLDDLFERKKYLADENRPEKIQKRHAKGGRTARENIADLCDDFTEFGSLIVAAQRGRKSNKELMEQTPADGLITGIGAINTNWFDEEKSKCIVMSYDYTVLAGTQGAKKQIG